jgi:hypothetical protein
MMTSLILHFDIVLSFFLTIIPHPALFGQRCPTFYKKVARQLLYQALQTQRRQSGIDASRLEISACGPVLCLARVFIERSEETIELTPEQSAAHGRGTAGAAPRQQASAFPGKRYERKPVRKNCEMCR